MKTSLFQSARWRDTIGFAVLLGILASPAGAFAHHVMDTNKHPLVGGFTLPIHGPDHILAMVAIGIWAVVAANGRRWLIPGSFLACMLAGMTLGIAQTGQALKGPQPGLLEDLARVLGLGQGAPQGVPEEGCMAIDELVEGLPLPRENAQDEVSVAGVQGSGGLVGRRADARTARS